MRSQAHIRQSKKLRRRRLLGRFFWILGFGLFGLMLLHLFSGWMLGPMIVRHLQQQTGASVYVDSAYWIGPRTVRLENLIISTEPNQPDDASLARIDRVDCSFSLPNLLRLRFRVRSVTIQDAVIQLRYDHNRSRWNFASLLFMSEPKQPSKVPVFFLDNALLRVQTAEDDRVQTLTSVGLQGQILSQDWGREYRFSLESTPRVAFYGSRIDGIWIRGKKEGNLTLVGQIRMPLTYVYGNAWNLEKIRLDCSYQKDRISIDQFSCEMGTGQMELQGTLLGPPGRRTLDVRAMLENVLLLENSKPNALVYSESILEILDPGLQKFLRRFHPEGFADARMQIRGNLADLAQSEINGTIVCRDIAVRDDKFPYRLEKMTGAIELTGKNLVLQNLQAFHGTSAFTIRGEVENMGPRARIHTHVTSGDLLLTEDLKRALPKRFQEKWLAFAPTGKCAIEYDFTRSPDQSRNHRMEIKLLRTECAVPGTLYKLKDLNGTLIYEPNQIEFREITSRPDPDQQITIRGVIEQSQSPAPIYDIQIHARRIPVNQAIDKVFRKSQRDFLKELDIDGRMDVDMHIEGAGRPDRPLPVNANITMNARSVLWKRFPLPFENMTAEASFQPDVLIVHSASARRGTGLFRLSGQINLLGNDPARPGGKVSFTARDLTLDPDFWKAVQTAKINNDVFSKMHAEGIIDLDGRIQFNVPGTPNIDKQLTIQFREGRLLGAQNDWQSGPAAAAIRVQNNRVELHDCTLLQMPVNTSFFELLPAKFSALSDLNPEAVLDVTVNQAAWSPDAQHPSFEAQGRVDIHRGQIPKLSVDQLEGFWEGRLARPSGQGSIQGSGQFEAQSFQILGRTITNLAGPWQADPNSGIDCPQITARCYEGRLSARMNIETYRPQSPYRMEIMFENIQLDPLLKADQLTEQNEPLAEGRLRGSIGLSGLLRQMQNTEGLVHLEAADMKLARESLFGKALTVMQFRKPSDYIFNEMLIEAILDKGVLSSERILFAGENSVYQGQGKLNLKDRSIQMELTAFGRRKDEEPSLLSALAESLGAALAKVEVSGTLDQPDIRPVTLPIIPRPF